MSDACIPLRDVCSNLLRDITSMSVDVIKWSDQHIKEVESIDFISVDTVTNNIQKLLERVSTNLTTFKSTLDTAVSTFKNSAYPITPKKKTPNLSLRSIGDSQKTDVNCGGESIENVTPQENTTDATTASSSIIEPAIVENNDVDDPTKSVIVENNVKNSENTTTDSDNDSEKTVQNFDVPTEHIDDLDTDDELDKVLEKLKENDRVETQNKRKISLEPASFNSDKVNNSNRDEVLDKVLQKLEEIHGETDQKNNKISSETSSVDFSDLETDLDTEANKHASNQDAREQAQRDNYELLELLNKATATQKNPETAVSEEEVDEAMNILDDEISLSTDLDSDDDDDNLSRKLTSSDVDSDDEWEPESLAEESDNEKSEEDKPPELKPLEINLKQRVDQMSDGEIDRLCNLNNLNKSKCVATLRKLNKRKMKRIRLLSSSSSSSFSDLSSEGSTTPDLVIDTQERPPSAQSIGLPDVTVLADECADKLDNEDDHIDISSDSSTDSELEPPRKKKKETDVKIDKQEVKIEDENKENVEKPEKKVGSWRKDMRLWTSDESDSDNEVIINEPTKDENNVADDDNHPINISDSESSSDSDDCLFVAEVSNDDMIASKGRRNIRAILSDDELNELTQKAKSEEDQRIQRLEEHSKTIELIQSQNEEFVLDVDVKTGRPLIVVNYNLAQILKPHQKDGVKFMWEACYGSVDILKTNNSGTGCILAHCMGLGKTLQVITLIHTLFAHPVTKTKHVLVTCPLSTVINWMNEIKKTYKHLNYLPNIEHFYLWKGDVWDRLRTVHKWRLKGGVLIMGYEAFQILSNEKISSKVTSQEKKQAFEALLDPGPDLIVCDEGHQLKNGKTLRTKALMKVKTKRRIVLTGTPLQNNLQEYYYMVQFVKPHILGTYHEYMNRFGSPIANGQYHDSRPEDIKLMKKRTHVLTKLLKKTVHRVESTVLSSYLPEIMDYTLFTKLTPLQMEVYIKYIQLVTSKKSFSGSTYLNDCTILNFSNLHPYTLHLYYTKPKPKKKKKKIEDVGIDDEQPRDLTSIGDDWYKGIFPEDISTNIEYSSKLKIIFDIINQTVRNGEKILIFCKYLLELDVLEHFLKVQGTKDCRKWVPEVDYYRMDGDTSIENRDQLCKKFNTNATSKVFLLTHRVGGLGLNLTGANRVIMIGSNHNPSLDTQSMYRVYRFGQTKKCYIYRLISLATMEEKIYNRCVVKLHLSGTVVDKLHFDRQFAETELREMYKINFEEYLKERPIPVVPSDLILATLLKNTADIYKYHLHNSLLENRPEEELTDEDKKLAWDEFNNMEEAAKLPVAPLLPPQTNPLMHLPIFPANLMYPYNRFGQLYGQRSNAPNIVPNPLNNNTRGFLSKSLLPNGMRQNNAQDNNRPHFLTPGQVFRNNLSLGGQNRPQTSGLNRSLGSDQNRRQTSGLNRSLGNDQNRPQISELNRFFDNAAPSPRQALQSLERLRASTPASQRLHTITRALQDGSRNVPRIDEAPNEEFNYSLNKVV